MRQRVQRDEWVRFTGCQWTKVSELPGGAASEEAAAADAAATAGVRAGAPRPSAVGLSPSQSVCAGGVYGAGAGVPCTGNADAAAGIGAGASRRGSVSDADAPAASSSPLRRLPGVRASRGAVAGCPSRAGSSAGSDTWPPARLHREGHPHRSHGRCERRFCAW